MFMSNHIFFSLMNDVMLCYSLLWALRPGSRNYIDNQSDIHLKLKCGQLLKAILDYKSFGNF